MDEQQNELITAKAADHGEETENAPVIGVARNDGQEQPIPDVLPILPLRSLVVFPGTVIPLSVGRASSRKLLHDSLTQSKVIGLFTQRNPELDNPEPSDLYRIGTAALVLKLIRQAEERVAIVVQALGRVRIRKVLEADPFIRAEVDVLRAEAPPTNDKQWEAT